MRIRHTIHCGHEGCPETLDRPRNVKYALCRKHRQAAQNEWWHIVREQAKRYREVLDLLNVKDEAKFIDELRRRKAAIGIVHHADRATCPHCGGRVGKFGSHVRTCAEKTPEEREKFRVRAEARKRRPWPESRENTNRRQQAYRARKLLWAEVAA